MTAPADPYLTFLEHASAHLEAGSTPRNAGRHAMDDMQALGFDADTVLQWFRAYCLSSL